MVSSLFVRRKEECEANNVFAIFRGYLMWDARRNVWREDEWLCEIVTAERKAKDALYAFADGRPFDNAQESQVTRYFGKRKNPFVRGEELGKGDPKIAEWTWMRYMAYEVG